jgi:hypothetical protein
MNRLLITTTCRKTNHDEPSGHLYVLDLDKWEIVQRGSIIEPPYRDLDPNPRGGFRGGKGIAIYDDQIILANTVAIFRFDQTWNLLRVISHPSCSGIHDILLDSNNHLWVTSARNDILFKFDIEGNLLEYFYFRQNHPNQPMLQWAQPPILNNKDIANGKTDFRDPRTHEISAHDSVHVNSISQHPDGSILVSLGLVVGKKFSSLMKIKDSLSRVGLWSLIIRINQMISRVFFLKKDRHSDLVLQPAKGKSVIIRLLPSGAMTSCLAIENVNVPSHSVLASSDGTAVYLNTTIGNIIHFDPENGSVISSTNVSNKFLRGVWRITDDDIIVGSQNRLLCFNMKTLTINKEINLSENKHEAVFAIHEFPERFDLPPKSFESHLGRFIGFTDKEAVFE